MLILNILLSIYTDSLILILTEIVTEILIHFKILLLTYKAINGFAPFYLQDLSPCFFRTY